jgi:hypothetical protein
MQGHALIFTAEEIDRLSGGSMDDVKVNAPILLAPSRWQAKAKCVSIE